MGAFEAIYPLTGIDENAAFVIAALFTRLSLVAFLAPAIGERATALRIRLAAAFGLTFILAPLFLDDISIKPQTMTDFAAIILAEAICGAMLGFGLRLTIYVLQIAGSIIAQNVSLSQLFGPNIGFDSEPPYSSILVMAGVAMAVSLDLHFYLAGAIIQSYELFPLGAFPDGGGVAAWSLDVSGDALIMALSLSAPFVLLGFIYSVALAAASRAMPQLMAAFVGAPAIVFAGFALFAAAAPTLLQAWRDYLERIAATLFGLAS